MAFRFLLSCISICISCLCLLDLLPFVLGKLPFSLGNIQLFPVTCHFCLLLLRLLLTGCHSGNQGCQFCFLDYRHESQFWFVFQLALSRFFFKLPINTPSASSTFFPPHELLLSFSLFQLHCNCCHLVFSCCQSGAHHWNIVEAEEEVLSRKAVLSSIPQHLYDEKNNNFGLLLCIAVDMTLY